MKNIDESTYWALAEDETRESHEAIELYFLSQINTERWIRRVRILSIAAFCFSLLLGICVVLVYPQGSELLMLSGAFYYFFGGIGVLAVAWRFRDCAEDDEELGRPTREQITTAIIAGTFVIGGITILLCSVFHVQLQIQIREPNFVWLPLAVGFGGFLVIAALQHNASIQLCSQATKAAAVYSALMSVLSLGLMVSHLVLAYDIMEDETWLFFDPVIADVVAVVSIVFGVKVALCDISGNHCWGY